MLALTDTTVALGGAVELPYGGHLEPLLELPPDLRFDAVAKHDPQSVSLLLRSHWLGQQVAADLTDILARLAGGEVRTSKMCS